MSALADPRRLAQVRGFLAAQHREQLDRLARVAARALGAQVGLISLVDDEAQHFAGASGLGSPWADTRTTPLSHSFCQHVVTRAAPLVVEDARTDALVQDNLAIEEIGVLAYLGVPLVSPSGQVLGSVCAIEPTPRTWSEEDQRTLEDVAALVNTELRLIAAVDEAGVGLRALQGALDDVTVTSEQRRREDDRLARTIAHEVRTPLLAIRNLCEDQREGLGEPGDLDQIDRCAHEALRIVDAQLQVTRQAVAETVRIEDVDTDRLLVALRGMLLPLKPPGVDLVVEPPPAGLTTLRTDPVKLGQVLRNLMTNALRHTAAGTVHLGLTARGHQALFTVSDTGSGIATADQDRIFEDGTQLGATAGTGGMGLPLARRLARLLGGDVTVESVPGEGARFTVAVAARLDG